METGRYNGYGGTPTNAAAAPRNPNRPPAPTHRVLLHLNRRLQKRGPSFLDSYSDFSSTYYHPIRLPPSIKESADPSGRPIAEVTKAVLRTDFKTATRNRCGGVVNWSFRNMH
jgi:hypothetical protein